MATSQWPPGRLSVAVCALALASLHLAAGGQRDHSCRPCSMQDDDTVCLDRTIDYFDARLLEALRNWTYVQNDVELWLRRHSMPGRNVTTVAADSAGRWRRLLDMAALKAEDKVLDDEALAAVANTLADRVNATYGQRAQPLQPFQYACPVPPYYSVRLWQWLFAASCALNVLMVLTLCIVQCARARPAGGHKVEGRSLLDRVHLAFS